MKRGVTLNVEKCEKCVLQTTVTRDVSAVAYSAFHPACVVVSRVGCVIVALVSSHRFGDLKLLSKLMCRR